MLIWKYYICIGYSVHWFTHLYARILKMGIKDQLPYIITLHLHQPYRPHLKICNLWYKKTPMQMINFEHIVLLCEAQYTGLMFSIEKSCLYETQVLLPMVENLFTSCNILIHRCFKLHYIYSTNNLQTWCRYFLLKPQVKIEVIFPIFCSHHLLPT